VRYKAYHDQLVNTVLQATGESQKSLRSAILERTRRGSEAHANDANLAPAVQSYVDTVARHAYKVTDAHVAALHDAGQSDDGIFEVTVVAAVGAALRRLDRGLAALRSQEGKK
jgi:hypothetical protein